MPNPSPSRVNRRVKGGHCFDPSPAKVVVIDARTTPQQVTVQQVTPHIRSGDGEGGRGEGATERQGCHWDPGPRLPLIRCLGKVQRQPGDELLYTVVDTLRVCGFAFHGGPERPWRSWILFTETTARATPPWSRAVGGGWLRFAQIRRSPNAGQHSTAQGMVPQSPCVHSELAQCIVGGALRDAGFREMVRMFADVQIRARRHTPTLKCCPWGIMLRRSQWCQPCFRDPFSTVKASVYRKPRIWVPL